MPDLARPSVPTTRCADLRLRPSDDDRPRRVVVVTGSFGAGHDAAARQIARRFRERGHLVRVHDVVDFFPWETGRALRAVYLWQLRAVPRSWGLLLAALPHPDAARRRIRTCLRPAAGNAMRAVGDADLVVSTHPFASQIFGEARTSGDLRAPCATYLTDASVHPLWVHPGVDLHLAWHPVPAAQARRHGAITAVVEPLVPPGLAGSPLGRAQRTVLRAALGFDAARPVALVVGGSRGIGALEATARDVLATGLAQPAVLCGTNARLHHRVSRLPGAVAVGWRDDLDRVLHSVQVVVQNAGGFTSLEALAAGIPVISYRCLPGHGRSNAAALEEAGLVSWARTFTELGTLLRDALDPRFVTPTPLRRPDLVEVLLGPPPRTPHVVAADLPAPA